MAGVQDLAVLLRSMEPVLWAEPYGYSVRDAPVAGAFACVMEEEGVTVIAPLSLIPDATPWARISLTVHSDLEAVGLTAALAAALAAQQISANVVAGFHHDHIFVPWHRRDAALSALLALSRDA